VHMLLVVAEKLKLLGCEVGRFKCHLETVCRLGWLLDIFDVSPMNFLEKIESVLETGFLSG
jgi:hypothetical protein